MPEPRMGAPVVVLTRPEDRSGPLRHALEAQGLAVLDLPCSRIEPVADPSVLARALADLDQRDLLVLTSAAASAAIRAATEPARVRAPVAAVGAVTAQAARTVGLHVTFVATRPDGATLARELPLPAGDVVLARSDRAARDLPEILRQRGARVRELEAYRTVPGVSGDVAAVRLALERGRAVVVFASPTAVVGMLGAVAPDRLGRAALVAIGPTTAAAIRERIGSEPIVSAAPDTRSFVAAIVDAALSEVPA